MEFKIIKLHFETPVHFGKGVTESYDKSERTLHSDTISGALAATYARLNPGKDVRAFLTSFKVSSAFPFSGKNFFFPKPMMKLPFEESKTLTSKMLKKVEFFDLPSFGKLINGSTFDGKKAAKCISGDGRFFVSNNVADFLVPFFPVVTQRVTVQRGDGGDSQPFYFERLIFTKESGLWFIFDVKSELQSLFYESLIHLGENGLGTDRTVGNGQFSIETGTIELELANSNNSGNMLLSLYWPDKEELANVNLGNSSYLLIKRGGFIAGSNRDEFRHLRKKSVYMFREGSIVAGPMKGKIGNLRPEWNDVQLHPVWRDGRAFSIPVISKTL